MAIDSSKPAKSILGRLIDWFRVTPERAIAQAYSAAAAIKKIEDDFFKGEEISPQPEYADNTYSLFRIQLNKHLETIDVRLAEYRISARILPLEITVPDQSLDSPLELHGIDDLPITQKLAFIDVILSRYRRQKTRAIATLENPVASTLPLLDLTSSDRQENRSGHNTYLFSPKSPDKKKAKNETIPVEKSILPGSFFRTVSRIRSSLTSKNYRAYEKDVVTELRQSQRRARTSLQYFGMILLAFFLAQQTTKFLVFSPLVDYWNRNGQMELKFAPHLQVEVLAKFREIKEKIELENIVASANLADFGIERSPERLEQPLNQSLRFTSYESTATVESPSLKKDSEKPSQNQERESPAAKLKDETVKLVREFNSEKLEGIKNAFADVAATFASYILIFVNRKQLLVVKEFLDETLYSLNDSARAFLIIVFTDTFVGFHSSEGWDAIIGGLSRHYGLPENRFFTMIFIASVPVFLDALFKFWIFQYLRQTSPSTGAIFEQMNQ